MVQAIVSQTSFVFRELVSLLHERQTSVYVISGGFRQLIEPIVEVIGIPNKRLYCNKLLFDDNGE